MELDWIIIQNMLELVLQLLKLVQVLQQLQYLRKLPIPSWIKNNAEWWAAGQIDDDSFVQGIQYLIKEDILKIPPTSQGTGSSLK